MDGLFIIDKPAGPTSHDVVVRVRRVLQERRVGHTGTLDPMASGVLPLVVGRATRLARFLACADKGYDAVVRLGIATDSYDGSGHPVGESYRGPLPTREEIDRALDGFRGSFVQQPPAYSAKKVDGRRSHRLARAHRLSASPEAAIQPAPVSVTADAIDIVDQEGDTVTLRVVSSAGFYVRSLAHDLGERLGTGAHLASLRRTRSGGLMLDAALTLESLERAPEQAAGHLIPLERMLPDLAAIVLTPEGVRRALHGRDLGPEEGAGDFFDVRHRDGPPPLLVRLMDSTGHLVGIAEPARTAGLLHPSVVLM